MNKETILNSAINIYFIIGLEILIMIGPLAGLFYAVFTPVLLEILKKHYKKDIPAPVCYRVTKRGNYSGRGDGEEGGN